MRRTAISMMAVLMLAVSAAPAGASSPPQEVTIRVETVFDGISRFTAEGPAVESGMLCNRGTVTDLESTFSGSSDNGLNIQVTKRFHCRKGSTFDAKLQVRVDFDSGVTFNWVTIGGTGAYATIQGSGSGVGLPPEGRYDILDLYFGKVH